MNYLKDNPIVLAALIVAAGLIIAAFVYQYNSPLQVCLRAFPPDKIGHNMCYLNNR